MRVLGESLYGRHVSGFQQRNVHMSSRPSLPKLRHWHPHGPHFIMDLAISLDWMKSAIGLLRRMYVSDPSFNWYGICPTSTRMKDLTMWPFCGIPLNPTTTIEFQPLPIAAGSPSKAAFFFFFFLLPLTHTIQWGAVYSVISTLVKQLPTTKSLAKHSDTLLETRHYLLVCATKHNFNSTPCLETLRLHSSTTVASLPAMAMVCSVNSSCVDSNFV